MNRPLIQLLVAGRAKEFITEQSMGEWDDKTIAKDAKALTAMIMKIFDDIATGEIV